ncbi:transcription initiation factor IIB 2 [Sulfolobales archaeon HS-7]|nr:transcription initiation factor IIB 2 [Sulfolobales archaeon HS-7]
MATVTDNTSNSECPLGGKHEPITDKVNGEVKCCKCGIVLEEQMIDDGLGYGIYNQEQKKQRNTYSPVNPLVHDEGLGTRIGVSRRNRIRGIREKIYNNRENKKSRIKQADKKLITALSTLHDISGKLGVTPSVKEEAGKLIRKVVDKGLMKRIDVRAVVAAAIEEACNIKGEPKSEPEILRIVGITKEEMWRAKDKITLANPDLTKKRKGYEPVRFVPQIVSNLQLEENIVTKAAELINEVKKSGLASGKSPLPIAAASVYLIAVLLGHKKTQEEVAKAGSITEVTVRNRYRDIVDNLDIKVYM